MKTTLEMPDALYRKLKSRAAARGTTVKRMVVDAVEQSLSDVGARHGKLTGWRAIFGIAPGTAEEINRIVEEEFGQIDPEDWK